MPNAECCTCAVEVLRKRAETAECFRRGHDAGIEAAALLLEGLRSYGSEEPVIHPKVVERVRKIKLESVTKTNETKPACVECGADLYLGADYLHKAGCPKKKSDG